MILTDGTDTKTLTDDELAELGLPCSCRWADARIGGKISEECIFICLYHEAMEDQIKRLKRKVKRLEAAKCE